jgi:O-acetyl-ADP-ribose deacetylase (regulator of RNase III)
MTRCLKEAEERKLSSIAFPALGTGILGYPPCLTAKTMFDAVEEYQKTLSPLTLRVPTPFMARCTRYNIM